MRTISALVVTYDHEHEIAECVEAALAQNAPDLDVEAVVVDNASSDATVAVLRGFGRRIRLVERTTNSGFAEGVNEAFAAAATDSRYVLLLNPDVVMDPGCVAELVAHLEATPDAAGAAALLRNADDSPQLFCRRDPRAADLFLNHTTVGRRVDAARGWRGARRWRYADLWDRVMDGPFAVDAPAGACVLFRRDDLQPRPLDPAFPLFFNDGDLYRRLRAGGRHVDVVPAAGAGHAGGTSVRRAGAADIIGLRAEWVVSSLRYMRRWHGRRQAALAWTAYLADAVYHSARHAAGRAEPSTPSRVRGTLGGLGLPGGGRPFLSRPPRGR